MDQINIFITRMDANGRTSRSEIDMDEHVPITFVRMLCSCD